MTLIAFTPGIHLLKGIVIVAKRIDEGHSVSSSPSHRFGGYYSKNKQNRSKNRRDDEPPRTIHYDSLQYVYIDIEDTSTYQSEAASPMIKDKQQQQQQQSRKQHTHDLSMQSIPNLTDIMDENEDGVDARADGILSPLSPDSIASPSNELNEEKLDEYEFKTPVQTQTQTQAQERKKDEEVSVTTTAVAAHGQVVPSEMMNEQGQVETQGHPRKAHRLSMDEADENDVELMNEAEHQLFALKQMVQDEEEEKKKNIGVALPVMHENRPATLDDQVKDKNQEKKKGGGDINSRNEQEASGDVGATGANADGLGMGNDASRLSENENDTKLNVDKQQDSLVSSSNAAPIIISPPNEIVNIDNDNNMNDNENNENNENNDDNDVALNDDLLNVGDVTSPTDSVALDTEDNSPQPDAQED